MTSVYYFIRTRLENPRDYQQTISKTVKDQNQPHAQIPMSTREPFFFSLIFLWAFPFPPGFFSTWKPPRCSKEQCTWGYIHRQHDKHTRWWQQGTGRRKGQTQTSEAITERKKRQEGYVYAFASHDTPSQDA